MGRHLLRRQNIKRTVFFVIFCILMPVLLFAAVPQGDLEAQSHSMRIPLDIPVPLTAEVEAFYTQFTSVSGKKGLIASMKNAGPYRSYIRLKIAEYGLPAFLEYLPVIESHFLPYAVSKSGATGLWQFMKNSIAPFNMRANIWLDERRDPWLSTDAALKKLRDNYRRYNDWYLALAAYNWGTGSIDNAIKKGGGIADYWYLCSLDGVVRSETKQYVPKLLVVADILTNNEYYGVEIPPYDSEAHLQFTVIETKKSVDIFFLANDLKCTTDELFFYNPALNTHITPPDQKYNLRIPSYTIHLAPQAIENNPLAVTNKVSSW